MYFEDCGVLLNLKELTEQSVLCGANQAETFCLREVERQTDGVKGIFAVQILSYFL